MSSFQKSSTPLRASSVLLLCASLAACGGGSGSGSGDTPPATSAPTQSSGASSPGNSSESASDVASGASGRVSSVGISDAVVTVRTLSVSAMLVLGLPVAPLVAPPLAVVATRVFHVDSTLGADANDGLSSTATNGSGPWRTLGRLATAGLAAGDRVELACGSVWHETLRLASDGAAGSPIVVTQPVAGCTALPSVDGSITVPPSAWSAWQGHIYRTALGAVPLQLFATNGSFTVAHFPNNADVVADPGSPYLALAADSSGAVLTTGNDLALPTGTTLDSHTRVHLRTNAWLLEESDVAAFDGTHITLAKAPTYTVRSGWGYFLTGQLWMLRAAGQWWYDPAAQQLYAWMPDSTAPTAPVGVSTLPVGVDLQGRNHVVIDGIAVHGVGLGVDARSTADVTLRNMLVEDIADVGIDVAGSNHDVVENNGVARTGSDAITGWGGAMDPLVADSAGLAARDNVIRDSGVRLDGDRVTSLPRRSLAALFIGVNSRATGNIIVNAGYHGIVTQPGATVTDNFVYGACSVQDDCGGIYTGRVDNGSQIVGNTVMHSRGALFGQPVGARSTSAQGIYIDDLGSDVVIRSNTVIDTDYGIQLHNTARNSLLSNRLFANRRAQIWMQEDSNSVTATGDMIGNVVSANQVAPVAPTSAGLLLTSRFANTAAFGTFTSNRFYDRISATVAANSAAQGSQALGFGAWSGSTGDGSAQPVDAQGMAVSGSGYAAYVPTGGNIVPNGSVQSDNAGWNLWNESAPAGQMTRTACPAGTCLRFAAGSSSGILSSPGFALRQGAWYRITVDAAMAADGITVPLVVRRGSGDYATLSDHDLAFKADRAWSRHSAVFQATQTVAGTGARVDLDRIWSGQSVQVSHLEIVEITPDATARISSVVVNAAATPLSAGCPMAASQQSLCSQLFDLANSRPVTFPLDVPPRSAVILYVQNPARVDSDGDGIPDAQDACPGTPPGAPVDATGCPLTPG